MPFPLRIAFVFGLTPLFIGTLIFIAWLRVRLDWLETAGLITIVVGFVLFLGGLLALLLHLIRENDNERRARSMCFWQSCIAGGLLFANFPAALLYCHSALELKTSYTVVVHNQSSQPVDSFVVRAPGIDEELGPIGPNQLKQLAMHFRGDGPLQIVCRQEEVLFEGKLEGYVTSGVGGMKTVRITQKGAFEIEPKESRP